MAILKSLVRSAGVRRSQVATARLCCERTAIASLAATTPSARSRILCYHSVGTPAWGVNDVSPGHFRRQIELALKSGHRFVPAGEIARSGGQPGDLAITFDDGLSSVAENAAPILAEYGVPWTMFVVTDWADGRHPFGDNVMLGWRDVERIAGAGATIASHSVTHPNFAYLSPQAAVEELASSREVLRSRTGIDSTSFAIPLGQSQNWPAEAQEAAAAAGYTTIYAQSEQLRPKGTIPRTFITRFDGDRVFRAALSGAFDHWEEWL